MVIDILFIKYLPYNNPQIKKGFILPYSSNLIHLFIQYSFMTIIGIYMASLQLWHLNDSLNLNPLFSSQMFDFMRDVGVGAPGAVGGERLDHGVHHLDALLAGCLDDLRDVRRGGALQLLPVVVVLRPLCASTPVTPTPAGTHLSLTARGTHGAAAVGAPSAPCPRRRSLRRAAAPRALAAPSSGQHMPMCSAVATACALSLHRCSRWPRALLRSVAVLGCCWPGPRR